ncbi:hypothetical protein TBR22_A12530 [Luteitalea sp. TBR-22]|uniref:carbonic anhydrase n=1 Tax=Luteitalea sp. TBR-22 TaxID=2802971 RepID=UPI001AF57F6C|nr:carbonic anhydrase [Luteitalea sp. TBR-22]BCS32048.1 hypothetical protein TBR22_A12530 [Luteitalea sp. TBR-22]
MTQSPDPHAGGHDAPQISPAEALQRLKDGNERFLRGTSRFTGMDTTTLDALAGGQQPFATLLGCADSRVPPELIFDAVLGELFVVRVAGNVLSPEVAGSLQYAGAHLRTPIFVVLGHEGCGAVSAALQSHRKGVQHLSRIQLLVDSILPAIADVSDKLPPQQQLAAAVEANVRHQIAAIRDSPEARAREASGGFLLIGAIYDLATGRVRWLDERNV